MRSEEVVTQQIVWDDQKDDWKKISNNNYNDNNKKKIEGIFSEERLTQADFYVERKGGEREGLEN